MSDSKMLEQYAKDYNDRIQELWDKLMGLELQLVDQLEVRNKLRDESMKTLFSQTEKCIEVRQKSEDCGKARTTMFHLLEKGFEYPFFE